MSDRFARGSMKLGGILTAMVTPFDADGGFDEENAARLMHHLLENGSDGLVLAGSTGEGATLTDEEKFRLWELGVAEAGGAPVIAGTGTYDTRHSCELTERATEIGVDAVLVVTPYYNKPNRRGCVEHFKAVAAATDRPVIVYNIPSRCVVDLPNDLLAELAQIENVAAVKQARYEDVAPIDGMELLAGNDDMLAKVLDLGGPGGILVSSHLVGREMRRMIDEPDARAEIHEQLSDLFKALFVTTNPIPLKAALRLAGHDAGGLRLPLVEASDEETATIRDGARAPRPAGTGVTDGALRVLPLGGLGEIGKNMTVVEYGGRIVVIDTGLMFPAPDQLGIDLVLPDFTYLRERADDIEAIVLTHGHEDHVGALPYVLRELERPPPVYGGPLTAAMVRSKLDEHKMRDVKVDDKLAGSVFQAGPFSIELVKMSHSIPDAFAVAMTMDLGTILLTGDYKFDQTPVDGVPADVGRLAELGRDGLLLLCGDSTNADRPGMSLSEASVGPRLEETFSRCEGRIIVTCFASNIHRVQQVVDAAAQLGRKVSLVGRSMRKNVNIGRTLGHIDIPDGMLVGAEGDRGLPRPQGRGDLHRQPGRAAVRAAPDGARRPPERRRCTRATRSCSRPRRSRATSAR